MVVLAMAVAVVCGTVGCSKKGSSPDNPVPSHEGEYTPSTIPVGFTAHADWTDLSKSTKGGTTESHSSTTAADPSITEFYPEDEIALFGYYLTNSATVATTAPNFMYNQSVVCDEVKYNDDGDIIGSTWSYSPVKYWPNNEQDKISFYALFPHPTYYNSFINDDFKLVLSPNTQLGPPQLTYKMPTTVSAGKVDFLYAQTLDQTKPSAGETTVLEFMHLLGKIQFFVSVLPPDGSSLSLNDGNYSAYIKCISYNVNVEGTFKYTFVSGGYPEWEVVKDNIREFSLPYTPLSSGVQFSKGKVDDNTVGQYGHNFTAFLLPVTITQLNVKYSTDGVEFKDVPISNQNISVEAGKVTTVRLVIKPDEVQPITVSAVTEPWKEVVISPEIIVTP